MKDIYILVKSEFFKLKYEKLAWLALLIIPILVILSSIAINYYQNQKPIEKEWKIELINKNHKLSENIKKNPDLAKYYIEEINLNNYRIDKNIKPIEKQSMLGLLENILPLLLIVKILVIVLSSTIISKEFHHKTIKLLVTKPFKRHKILLSKYITIFLYSTFLYIFFILCVSLTGIIIFGNENMNQIYLVYHERIEKQDYMYYIFLRYIIFYIEVFAFMTIGFTISSLFKNNIFSICLSFLLIMIGDGASSLFLQKFEWSKYLIFYNTNFTKYLTGEGVLPNTSISFSLVILSIYCLILFIVSLYNFTRRDIVV